METEDFSPEEIEDMDLCYEYELGRQYAERLAHLLRTTCPPDYKKVNEARRLLERACVLLDLSTEME